MIAPKLIVVPKKVYGDNASILLSGIICLLAGIGFAGCIRHNFTFISRYALGYAVLFSLASCPLLILDILRAGINWKRLFAGFLTVSAIALEILALHESWSEMPYFSPY
jgi:hypothetical protein